MPDVVVDKPVAIALDLAEFDECLPSLRMSVRVDMPHSTGIVSYQADSIWFQCSDWDTFLLNLNGIESGNEDRASLSSMSNELMIKIEVDGMKVKFDLHIKEPDTGMGEIDVKFGAEIDRDVIAHLKGAYMGLAKFW